MALPGSYLVICEGASEAQYLLLLNRFMNDALRPPKDLNGFPLRFNLPLLSNNKNYVGNGHFSHLKKAYGEVYKNNARDQIIVWADWDLYARNDKETLNSYLQKAQNIPDFRFPFQNFEDFIAMHLEEDDFQTWLEMMDNENHWQSPLHSESYEPLFKEMLSGYKKGHLDSDFLTLERLHNLQRHLPVVKSMLPPPPPPIVLFAEFLIEQLEHFYPQEFPTLG